MVQSVTTASYPAMERRIQRRDQVEYLLSVAEHLPRADQVLIEQAYGQGTSVADLARLAGRSRRAVQTRLARLTKRIRQPMFAYVVLHGDLLPSEARRVARLVVLHGYSLRHTAAALDRSLHYVREQMHTIRALARL